MLKGKRIRIADRKAILCANPHLAIFNRNDFPDVIVNQVSFIGTVFGKVANLFGSHIQDLYAIGFGAKPQIAVFILCNGFNLVAIKYIKRILLMQQHL
ncbi:hypothetical protein D3C85_968550 [compost metagenome]